MQGFGERGFAPLMPVFCVKVTQKLMSTCFLGAQSVVIFGSCYKIGSRSDVSMQATFVCSGASRGRPGSAGFRNQCVMLL